LVVAESKKHGRPTPVNDAIVEITHEIEAGRLKPGLENIEILRQRIATT